MSMLIDPNPSEFGTSFHQAILKCPQFASYRYNLGLANEASDGQQRGSLIHVGLAHHYAREAIRRGIPVRQDEREFTSESQLFDPIQAMDVASQMRGSQRWIELARRVLNQYTASYGMDDLKAHAVEHVLRVEIDGFVYGQRVDLIGEDQAGRIWLVDHKTQFQTDQKTLDAFALEIQFLGYHMLGQSFYGNQFGGVLINCLSTGKDPFKFSRHRPAFAPWALAQLPGEIARVRREWEALKAAGTDPWEYPKRLHANVCFDRYGPCSGYNHCKMGPTISPIRQGGNI